jgi:8-oxo-dGTP diphosphatase
VVLKRMGAAAIIFDEAGRVLLVKHTYGELNWELPGGGSEGNESMSGTAVRETWEETGLRVEVERLIGIYYLPSLDAHGLTFLCRNVEPQQAPTPSSAEISECRYWPVDALPRPMSDWTQMRINHGVEGVTRSTVDLVGPPKWMY